MGVQDRVTGRFGVWWGPASRLTTTAFLPCPHMAEGARELLGASFTRMLIPYIRGSFSWPCHLLNAPPPDTSTLGIRVLQISLQTGAHIQSMTSSSMTRAWPAMALHSPPPPCSCPDVICLLFCPASPSLWSSTASGWTQNHPYAHPRPSRMQW